MRMEKTCKGWQRRPLNHHSVHGSSSDFMGSRPTWMKSTEEKSPCNSRPIIGILIVGGRKTKDKELVALVHFMKFHFPQQSR